MTARGTVRELHAAARTPDARSTPVALGLRANRVQFSLLVLINAFVGAMVGLERSVLPLVASHDFGIAAATGAISFIAIFGFAKALTNLTAGRLADRWSRRAVLIGGWVAAVPVPLLILWARSWTWVVAANALLGISQGLAWSTTVVMKIDLVGPRQRGLAMGLNECAGYVAVATAAFGSGIAATRYGLRAGPAYLGLGVALAGLLLSVLFARDTSGHVAVEASLGDAGWREPRPSVAQLIRHSVWSDADFSSACQAGLVNNLNDGLAWGIFPLFFAAAGMSLPRVGLFAATYPAVWGVCQLFTGPLSDRWGRKRLVVWGMVIQGAALLLIPPSHSMGAWIAELGLLGLGTAMVYPSLLAAVSDLARPSWRATAVGVYRLWRDMGYVVGALLAGALADVFGVATALVGVGILTIGSGLLAAARWHEPSRGLSGQHG